MLKIIATLILIMLQIGLIVVLKQSYPLFSQAETVHITPIPIKEHGLLLSLDSRPPCLDFTQKLAHLAGLDLTEPPRYLMDNYKNPAQFNLIKQWTYNNINRDTKLAILSTDMLVHGGLIASRTVHDATDSQNSSIQLFSLIKNKNNKIFTAAFSVIPRLLIAEDNYTRTWQFHMMQYAIYKDKENTFGNPLDFAYLQKMQSKIPQSLIDKYNKLYADNDKFNNQLVQSFMRGDIQSLIIGQDDGEPFGLPNTGRHKADSYLGHLPKGSTAYTTRGADEIAQMLVAQYFNLRHKFTPKIYLHYAKDSIKDKIMPYMPSSVDETVRDKVNVIQGSFTDNINEADFILFVHCGDMATDSFIDRISIASTLKSLQQQKPVALVDLSANFESYETILPYLLANDTPLVQLAAYAGWNTTSNAIGTALSQASIFSLQKKLVAPGMQLNLYYQNANFTLERIIEDWGYLKEVLPHTNAQLKFNGIDNYALGKQQKNTQDIINSQLASYTQQLLYDNISRHAFYKTPQYTYFIRNINSHAVLPWERTFEINLNITTHVVRMAKQF